MVNQGQTVRLKRLSDDIKENDNMSITYETVSDYVDALKMLLVIEDIPVWNPNLRSKSAIQVVTVDHKTMYGLSR